MSEITFNKLLPFYKAILNSIPESIDFNFIPANKAIGNKIFFISIKFKLVIN